MPCQPLDVKLGSNFLGCWISKYLKGPMRCAPHVETRLGEGFARPPPNSREVGTQAHGTQVDETLGLEAAKHTLKGNKKSILSCKVSKQISDLGPSTQSRSASLT